MANPFLVGNNHDHIETALLYEKAKITDIGKAVAYTDGNRIFLNTDENLMKLLPLYDPYLTKMFLLWHEEYHIRLKHHKRFFKYLKELEMIEGDLSKFQVTKDEVNIIMDILVHDIILDMLPEIVETAIQNMAQLRDRNSLMYTFKTRTLEEMLTEYSEHKKQEGGSGETSSDKKEGETGDSTNGDEKETDGNGEAPAQSEKGTSEQQEEENTPSPSNSEETNTGRPGRGRHDEADWSKLDDISNREFITSKEADMYEEAINELKRRKLKMGRLTHTLNSLATTKRDRTYRLPSMLQTSDGCIFKGKTPGRTELYLIFDASGSMSGEINTFKEIITNSIPQAMKCPCEWFAGYDYEGTCSVKPYKKDGCDSYYKGTYKDFLPIHASGGYSDDGDRTIELCWQAEQKGYTPIGITDGGYRLSWSKNKLKELKRTIFVGHEEDWLKEVKKVNPSIQILVVDM